MSGSLAKAKGCLPIFTCGHVVKGFGRGSKELGIPTANLDASSFLYQGMRGKANVEEKVLTHLPGQVETGIYYGWANVDQGEVHKMVVSIGWNPFYKNEKKSMETHILHEFPEDFYGAELRTAIVGYIREEKDYPSLAALIEAIHSDIATAKRELDSPEALALKDDPWFTSSKNSNCVISPSNS